MLPASALDRLLSDLGSQIRLGGDPGSTPLPRCATGLPGIDRLLQGGLPRGQISELTAPHRSSGQTSVQLALLAQTTRGGECAAVVDRADAFDPASAAEAGVILEQVLWVRVQGERETLRSTERLLETEGFPLVLLDLRGTPEPDSVAWTRLARLAAGMRTALVVLSERRVTGSHADIALELSPVGPSFVGRRSSAAPARDEGWPRSRRLQGPGTEPVLLEALESRARVVRHRRGPAGNEAPVRLGHDRSGPGAEHGPPAPAAPDRSEPVRTVLRPDLRSLP